MTRIGFFADTQERAEGSIECLAAFEYEGDLAVLSERLYAITSHLDSFDFAAQLREEMGENVIFYTMTGEFFEEEFAADGDDRYYEDSSEVTMGNENARVLPTDPGAAAAVVFDTVPQKLRYLGYYEVINPLTDSDAVDAFIADRATEDEAIKQAEFVRANVRPGDEVYPVRLNAAQLTGKRVISYADNILSSKRKFNRDDRADDYINVTDVKPLLSSMVEIFPLPSNQRHKWYGRVVDQPLIEVTGNNQDEIRLRLAVILAARARNAS